MARADVFALETSDLNGFLFADIGVEGNGMSLSVISLLARLGLDPWIEAGRMARLPRTAAADALARLIAAMPASLWPMSDAAPIATRLVALLPSGIDIPAVAKTAIKIDWRWLLLASLAAALLAQSAIHLANPGDADRPASASLSAPSHSVQPPTQD